MPTSIIVDRLALIAELEKEQKASISEYKRDMERWRKAEAAYPAKLARALEIAAKEARRGRVPKETTSTHRGGRWYEVPLFEGWPERVKKPTQGDTCAIERMIRTLKLSTRKEVRVGEKSEYTRFVCRLNGNGK